MRRTTFVKMLFVAVTFLLGSGITWGQATLPVNASFSSVTTTGPGTMPTGFTQNGLGGYAGALKFDTQGDYLILNFIGTPGTLSFNIKWNQSTSATRFPGDFTLQESADGINYTTVQLYNATNGTALANGTLVPQSLTSLLSTTRYLKWIYTAKSNGNIALSGIGLTAGTLTCTSSNLAFADATISKISTDVPFIKTVTSLNSTTAIVYSSNNTSVATVNSATGEVTILGAGTATITANQAAGTYNSVDYCAAVATYTLNVASVAPTITVTEVTVPAMMATVGNSDSKTVTVSGINLTDNIALALSGTDAAMFSLSQASVSQTAGTAASTVITVNYTPTAPGSHTTTLTLTSPDATSVTRTLNGTATWPPLAKPVATDATGISTTGFTANWEAVSGAMNYEVNVFTKTGNLTGFDNAPTAPADWTLTGVASYTETSTGYFGKAAPAVKFDSSNDVAVTPTFAFSPNFISFWLRGATTDATSALLVEGYDGSSWVTIENIKPLPTTGTVKSYCTTGVPALQNNFVSFRFTYTKSAGNLAFDDFGAYSVTPVVGSPFTVTEALSQQVTGLDNATVYNYMVVAKNANVTSEASNEISVSTSTLTGVNDVAKNVNVRVSNGKLIFISTANQLVEIYNAVGQKLISKMTVEGLNSIPVATRGVVIIKLGNRVSKVIL